MNRPAETEMWEAIAELAVRRGLIASTPTRPFPSCNVPKCDNPAFQDRLCRRHFEEHRDNGGFA